MALYATTKGSCIEDIVFNIVDQIDYRAQEVQNSELRCDLAKLYETAGTKAAHCSDYGSSRSYFRTALMLLPSNHWESQYYDRSLRLYYHLATSAYSSGDVTEADTTLRNVICQARCLEDKLKSYYRLILILHGR